MTTTREDRSTRKSYDGDIVQLVLRMHRDGVCIAEIARETGVARRTATKWVQNERARIEESKCPYKLAACTKWA